MSELTNKPKICVSIVLYQNPVKQLEAAIQSCLLTDPAKVELKIRLIDNSPTDSLKVLEKLDPRVSYHFVGRNAGFGFGHNLAIRENLQWSDFHLVLNPDIRFTSDVITELARFMEHSRDVGLCIPKVLYPDGSLQFTCRLLPTPMDLIFRRLPFFGRWGKKAESEYELRNADFGAMMDIPFLSGCFMFLRSSTLKEVGVFDDRYFMYMEDADLSRRIFAKSRCVFVPTVSVFHEYQRGSKRNWRLLRIHLHSAFSYFNKWGWFFDGERKRINRVTKAKYLAKPHTEVEAQP